MLGHLLNFMSHTNKITFSLIDIVNKMTHTRNLLLLVLRQLPLIVTSGIYITIYLMHRYTSLKNMYLGRATYTFIC